jgi:hypothetical protein
MDLTMGKRYNEVDEARYFGVRANRRIYRANAKKWGLRVPKLKIVCLVEPEVITIPAWALAKAVPGLKAGPGSIWLGRIQAASLARMDRAEGGHPKLTPTPYRRCSQCGRGLIGPDAELRWEQDRQWEAHKGSELRYDRDEGHRGTYANGGNPTPCGPDCTERQKIRRS